MVRSSTLAILHLYTTFHSVFYFLNFFYTLELISIKKQIIKTERSGVEL